MTDDKISDGLLSKEEIHNQLMEMPSYLWVIALSKDLADYGQKVAKAQQAKTSAECQQKKQEFVRKIRANTQIVMGFPVIDSGVLDILIAELLGEK